MPTKKIVIDAPPIIDLYAAPNDICASIAEDVMSWIASHLVEAYAPKLLVIEVLGVLARHLPKRRSRPCYNFFSTNKTPTERSLL